MGIEGTYMNIIKAISDRQTAIIIHNSEDLNAFPLRSGTSVPHSHHQSQRKS